MSQKIRIVKAGFNAITETSPDNIVFSSDYNTLKYATFGSTSLTVDYSLYYHDETPVFDTIYYHRKVVEVTHSLGYVPFFIGYILDYPSAGNDTQLPVVAADGVSFATLSCYADSSKLYFVYYAGLAGVNSGTATYNLKYRIFKNDLGL